MTYQKKLIEVALPLEEISDASAYEKLPGIGPHPRGIHHWWSRKPLAASRAILFCSLVDDPDDPKSSDLYVEVCNGLPKKQYASAHDTARNRLLDFVGSLADWKNIKNPASHDRLLTKANELIELSTDNKDLYFLDPFAGGGAIPLEAQRLGLEANASDLNPVAAMINKALIEIPPYFAGNAPVNPQDRGMFGGKSEWPGVSGLAADLRYYGAWMLKRTQERIGQLYPNYEGEMVIAWLWVRTVKCPNPACAAMMPLTSKFDLRKKNGRYIWVEPHVDQQTKEVTFSVKHATTRKSPAGTVNRQGATCIICGTPVPFDYIREEGRASRMAAQLMAIVTKGHKGRNYYSPKKYHEQAADVTIPDNAPDTNLPDQALGFRVQLYGMVKHRDLFTPRQLVALTTISDLVGEARVKIEKDASAAGIPADDTSLRKGGIGSRAYAEAVSVYLAFALDRCTDFNNSLTRWVPSNEKVMNLFAGQTIPMVWDYGEAAILNNVVGGWQTGVEYIANCIETLKPTGKGLVEQRDAADIQPNAQKTYIFSTDPPYYDNIGYADLSDFFYIWLRRNLKEIYPQILSTLLVPKQAELIASPFRFEGSSVAAKKHFEAGLEGTFRRIRSSANSEFPITIYYAFKQEEISTSDNTVSSTGWEKMLVGLINAGLLITGTWPLRSEQKHRLISQGANALASSILLVCRPRSDKAPVTSRRAFVAELRRELPPALKEMQSGNIAPVDLAQASIGPGMAVYSKYRQVLEANGEKMTVRTALQLINQVLDAYLAEQEGDLDGDSRFAVAWFEQFGFKEGQFGTADVLARAKNTSVDGLVQAGVIQSGAGKVRLLSWQELDPGWDPAADKRPTVWEATHHLIERLNVHGEEGAAMLLAKMPAELAADARALAYRLYSICERKSWAEQARDYNALVISWGASQERAAQVRTQATQGRLFK